MKGTLKMIGECWFLMIVVLVVSATGLSQQQGDTTLSIPPGAACVSQDVLTNTLRQLSGKSDDAATARATFLQVASKSTQCKAQVVSSIMKAMDKPDLDIRRNQADYYLWREGSRLLGELKASESLDLLISHIGMNDGEWSVSMAHQPALGGIIEMGPIAIPKLSVLLKSQDPSLRHDAVYCVSWIGGPSALRVLKQALRSETDKCIKRLIRASIAGLDNKRNKLQNNGEWLQAFLCTES